MSGHDFAIIDRASSALRPAAGPGAARPGLGRNRTADVADGLGQAARAGGKAGRGSGDAAGLLGNAAGLLGNVLAFSGNVSSLSGNVFPLKTTLSAPTPPAAPSPPGGAEQS